MAIAGKTVVCRGKSLNLNASGATTYSWSSGATVSNITVSPQTSTSYTVTGNLANGCSAKAVITVSVSECIGIEELNASEGASVLVYPNPNKGEFIIETAVETDIRIVNALGQIILQHHLSEGKNKINLGEHAIGIYFVKTKTTNYKIIKE